MGINKGIMFWIIGERGRMKCKSFGKRLFNVLLFKDLKGVGCGKSSMNEKKVILVEIREGGGRNMFCRIL